MGKPAKFVVRWLLGRQPRVVDYIVIAAMGAVLASLVLAVASGGGGNTKESGAASAAASAGPTLSATKTVVRTVAAARAPHVSAARRAFHIPDENVSCSLQADGARCSVTPANLTFILPTDGSNAYTVPGLLVPRDAGTETLFGTEQSEGEIVCDIPLQSAPAGITCSDRATGHGFEASRLLSRRKLY